MAVIIRRMTQADGRDYCTRTPIWPRAKSVILHHSSSPNSAQYRGLSTVQAIQRWHMGTPPDGRGWSDIGYHFLVGPDGYCYNGRPMNTLGAHSGPGQNHNLGVCAIGDFSAEDPWAWGGMESLRACLNALLARLGTGTAGLRAHREYMNTDCPGNKLDLARLRAYLAQGPGTPPAIDPAHPKIVLLPGSEVLPADARRVEDGRVFVHVRMVEGMGYEVIDEHLQEQGKLYLKRR